jgi:hypothetical protein
MPSVTIGVIPTQRFSVSAQALRRLFACTPEPFELLVVDCATPEPYRTEIDGVLAGRAGTRVLRSGRYQFPNQSINQVVAASRTDFVCIIDNDVLVADGWLTRLLGACLEHPADMAVPLIREGLDGSGPFHFDVRLGRIVPLVHGGRPGVAFVPRAAREDREINAGAERLTVQTFEPHCMLFRREVFEKIGPLDEELNTREFVDLMLALHHVQARIVLEPRCLVHYAVPPPVEPAEQAFFAFKWEPRRAEESHRRIQERWHVADMPGSMDFIRRRHHETSRARRLLHDLGRLPARALRWAKRQLRARSGTPGLA